MNPYPRKPPGSDRWCTSLLRPWLQFQQKGYHRFLTLGGGKGSPSGLCSADLRAAMREFSPSQSSCLLKPLSIDVLTQKSVIATNTTSQSPAAGSWAALPRILEVEPVPLERVGYRRRTCFSPFTDRSPSLGKSMTTGVVDHEPGEGPAPAFNQATRGHYSDTDPSFPRQACSAF